MKLIIPAKCVYIYTFYILFTLLSIHLVHDNIVKFEDLVESNNNIYFFMEYCAGGTLEKLLVTKKRLTESEALPLFK